MTAAYLTKSITRRPAKCVILRQSTPPTNRTKLVIGTSQSQSQYLNNLHAHTQSPEVSVPTQLIGGEEALKYEPDLSKAVTAALYSPETGIIDSHGCVALMTFSNNI